jgi:periplasmic divalent cation tolerance protein
MTLTLLYIPYPTAEAARATATALLNERLVACCNILPAMESHYWWEGALTRAEEVLMLAKTTPEMAAPASARIAELHPYACPAILALDANASAAFAGWVGAETYFLAKE